MLCYDDYKKSKIKYEFMRKKVVDNLRALILLKASCIVRRN